jgi:hypothetical protein
MQRTPVFAGLVAFGFVSTPAAAPSANPLVGVWKVAEIVPPEGEPNRSPQPTLIIFTPRYYSHVSVTSKSPRPNYSGPSLTDFRAGSNVGATSGTYELQEGEFTIRPLVAKNPGFTAPGSFMTFELTAQGKDIWIRTSFSPST